MNRLQFWTLNSVSVLLAGLIAFELHSSDQLDEANRMVTQAQVPLVEAQQIAPLAQRMVQRTAEASVRDPALRDLLVKYGFHLKSMPSAPDAAAAPTLVPASSNP